MRRPLVILSSLLIALGTRTAGAERHISEEALLFRKLRSGVVTIASDQGSGSGFLVDSIGIILTNDHVVGGSSRIRVKFDDTTRVDATFLTSDPKKDVAAIWVSPTIARRYQVLRLAQPSDTMVFEGEKVIALGSPLHQEKVMTSGIVSKVQPTAIISDVSINHGNSGGPLVNMDGEVIAINTFGDFTDQGGPGISGSITITEAIAVLQKARAKMATVATPSDSLLAIAPNTPFPLDSLQIAARLTKLNSEYYEISSEVGTGKFNVVVATPIYEAWRENVLERRLAKKMHKREVKGNVTGQESYDPTRQMREWMRYTGGSGLGPNAYAALVTIEMAPKIGQTTGSALGNILGAAMGGLSGIGYRGNQKYEFKADFKDVLITRDGVPIPDVLRTRGMVPLAFARSDWNADYSGEDMARIGIFQCTSDWFAPDSAGPPRIHVAITSVERPDRPYEFDLPRYTVKRVWSDFEAYREAYPSPERTARESALAAKPALGAFTIVQEDGTSTPARSIQPWGADDLKVVKPDGDETYVNTSKVTSIIGRDGRNWTKAVTRDGESLPQKD